MCWAQRARCAVTSGTAWRDGKRQMHDAEQRLRDERDRRWAERRHRREAALNRRGREGARRPRRPRRRTAATEAAKARRYPLGMRAGELREAFNSFWAERGHEVRASASLIPHEPSLLFTVAGMVPFMPYFLGEEVPPTRRMVTIQKCVRAGGKHNDLDDIGRTNRHFHVLRDDGQLQLR